MAAVLIRNLSEDTHRALKQRALAHGKSTEAEIRSILDEAAESNAQFGLGDLLVALGRKNGPLELAPRDRSPIRPAEFK